MTNNHVSAAEVTMKLSMACLVLWLAGLALADDAPKPMPAKEQKLQSELLHRTKTDQEARKVWIKWMNDHGTNGVVVTANLTKEQQVEFEKVTAKMKAIDEDNTKWLKDIVEKHGWPTNTLVGKDGASAAWLLVQHADADPKFQRRGALT
jgi:hypothetical protein